MIVPIHHLVYKFFPPIKISLKLKHGDHGRVLRHPPVKIWEKLAAKVTFHQPYDFKVVEEVHEEISHNYFLWLNTTKGEKGTFFQRLTEHVQQDCRTFGFRKRNPLISVNISSIPSKGWLHFKWFQVYTSLILLWIGKHQILDQISFDGRGR